MKVLITVAIPTYNRPHYLKQCLKSVVNQSCKNLVIVVLDNHSKDNLSSIIESFNDPRIIYIRNKKNIGIIENWNKAIKLCKTKYLSIFHDDDIMHPSFIEESIKVLEKNKMIGFSYCNANKVDEKLNYLMPWSPFKQKGGLIDGKKYIIKTIERGCCLTIAPTIVARKKAYDEAGWFNDHLCFNSFDFNMWLRIANKFKVFFINKTLVDYRIHHQQMSDTYWRLNEKAKGRLATMIEIQNAIYLLINKNQKTNQLKFLTKKMKKNNAFLSYYARILIKDL